VRRGHKAEHLSKQRWLSQRKINLRQFGLGFKFKGISEVNFGRKRAICSLWAGKRNDVDVEKQSLPVLF